MAFNFFSAIQMVRINRKYPIIVIRELYESRGITEAEILAKLEYLNPAGSVKDRIALSMIEYVYRRIMIVV